MDPLTDTLAVLARESLANEWGVVEPPRFIPVGVPKIVPEDPSMFRLTQICTNSLHESASGYENTVLTFTSNLSLPQFQIRRINGSPTVSPQWKFQDFDFMYVVVRSHRFDMHLFASSHSLNPLP